MDVRVSRVVSISIDSDNQNDREERNQRWSFNKIELLFFPLVLHSVYYVKPPPQNNPVATLI